MNNKNQLPQQWSFGLRLLSPAFVGGARPNHEAQLRLASLRGALRNWYRILVGADAAAGMVPGWPQKLLESELFGGAGNKQGQGRLLLSFAQAPARCTGGVNTIKAAALKSRTGLNYLGYSLSLGNNKRVAVDPDRAGEITIRAMFPRGIDPDQERLLLATWWLWTHFGGLGSRSQRGFGAFAVTHWPDGGHWPPEQKSRSLPELPLLPEGADLEQSVTTLGEGLERIMRWVEELRQQTVPEMPKRPGASAPSYLLRRNDTRFVVWGGPQKRGWQDWQSALDAMGEAMMEFRRERGRDGFGFSTLDALTHGESLPHAPHRAAFGLPLTYYRKGGRPQTLLPHGIRFTRAERMPSPLLLRPIGGPEPIFMTLLRLGGELPGRDVATQARNRPGYMPAFEHHTPLILDTFLQHLPAATGRTL